MQRNDAAAALLGRDVMQVDRVADLGIRVEDHLPGQVGDLGCAQTGLDRKQYDEMVTSRMAGAGSEQQEVFDVLL